MRRHPLSIGPVFLILGVLFLAIVGGGIGWFVLTVSAAEAEARSWREQHDASKLIGSTSDQIYATWGEPESVERDGAAQPVRMTYAQRKYGQIIVIELKQGVAVRWDQWSK